MKKIAIALFAVLVVNVAIAASRSFSGTIDTPAVLTWMDPSGSEVAPFGSFMSSMIYVDPATGVAWTIKGARSSAPYLAASVEASGVDLGLLYTTTNCTGAAYLAPATDLPRLVRISAGDGLFYADGPEAPVTIRSRWVGYCITENVAGPVYVANGPLTPPTLPAGPYHVVSR